ncbi:unnamed protein product [Caenorhabditis nigoni]
MSVGEVKKFVMKHVFNNFRHFQENLKYSGPKEEHFGVPWRIRVWRNSGSYYIGLDCLKPDVNPWNIKTKVTSPVLDNEYTITRTQNFNFSNDSKFYYFSYGTFNQLKECLIDGKLSVELKVEIKEITGIEIPKVRKFDDAAAKKFSDVVLMAGDQKFYVCKMYLSSHSTYFESLFSGNFAEFEKSIIELKDIDPKEFHTFLGIIHGFLLVEESNVENLLKLADFFDARIVVERCEQFLMTISKNDFVEKFQLSLKYKLDNLKNKCLSE